MCFVSQVIVLNKLPLLVTMIADINANTGKEQKYMYFYPLQDYHLV